MSTLAIAFLAILFCSVLLAKLGSRSSKGTEKSEELADFLLGSRTLGRSSVVNLLLSSSFGINAVFYAAWLGFTIGCWALLIQASWALSFFLLVPFAERFRGINSLHDFIGQRFDSTTRLLAAACSLVGIMFLVGWEVGIGKAAVASFMTASDGASPESAAFTAELLIVGVVFGTLLYTFLGGLRGNAAANALLNLLKIVVICALVFFSMHRLSTLENVSFIRSMFPSFETMRENLGLFGLITNVLFNVTWQFVDNSSWQSIIAGSEHPNEKTSRNLRYSGLAIFLTIGVLGTLLGASLAHSPDVTPDNILTMSVLALPELQWLFTVGMMIVIIACMMSLIDGMLLASALTVSVDIASSFKRTAMLSSTARLSVVRATLVIVAILSVWGIDLVMRASGASLFDFVYIVIVTQLALTGPVVVGLVAKRDYKRPMWIPIALGLVVGFGSVIVGTMAEIPYLLEGAGTITILVSLTSAYSLSRRVTAATPP